MKYYQTLLLIINPPSMCSIVFSPDDINKLGRMLNIIPAKRNNKYGLMNTIHTI